MTQPVKVEGLADLRHKLSKVGQPEKLPELKAGLKKAAEIVVGDARQRVPFGSGRARDSLRAQATTNRAYVVGGKARVPYYGWLDFGRRTPQQGNPRTVGPWHRTGRGPRIGRFIYPALKAKEHAVSSAVDKSMGDLIRKVGL